MASHFEPHPPEYREIAYEIYAFLADQNATKTANRINNPLPHDEWAAPEREIPARTIRAWAKTGKWSERAAKAFREIAPGIHAQVDQSIVAATVEAASYLRDLINDPEEDTKFRLDAAKTILDRGGHMPWVRPNDDSKPRGPVRDYSESIAGKTTDDLLALLFENPEMETSTEDVIEVNTHD